jgi:hypothetical protein
MLARPSGSYICTGFSVGPASPTRLFCCCTATRSLGSFPERPLCATSKRRKGGTTHHHHHRLSSHPVHVERYARYRCHRPARIILPEQTPSRARSIRRADPIPMQNEKHNATQRGRARITREGYEAASSASHPAAGSTFRRKAEAWRQSKNLLHGTALVFLWHRISHRRTREEKKQVSHLPLFFPHCRAHEALACVAGTDRIHLDAGDLIDGAKAGARGRCCAGRGVGW